MKPSKDRAAYIVLAPIGKSKIYSVACRKIGSRDRYTVIATCTSEVNADSIVDGLKLLQGEEVKVTTAAERALVEVRAQLTAERERHAKTSLDRRDAQNKVGELNMRIRELERKLGLAVPQPSLKEMPGLTTT